MDERTLSVFVEHREALYVKATPDARPSVERDHDRGISWTDKNAPDHHAWRPLGREPSGVEPAIAEGVATLLMSSADDSASRYADLATALVEHVSRAGAEAHVTVRDTRRRVLVGDDGQFHHDDNRMVQLAVRVTASRAGRSAAVLREHGFHSAVALDDARAGLLAAAGSYVEDALARLDVERCPVASLSIVIPPGADGGVFFHEICGHPLEGDVVAARVSYLAAMRGQRVADPIVSVLDGPDPGDAGVTFRIDDEGTPASTTALVRGGIVGEPLVDRRIARVLGIESNGHGRRTSYRHPPLPRMIHTALAPHQGTLDEIIADVREGLLVTHLTPRHVSLLDGAFSFFIPEARWIRDGRLGPWAGPCLLRGDGATALAAIDAVGSDVATHNGLKGCGKLDHGPLAVSFGTPTVRFRALRIEPWGAA